jgi:hypothetical protein
MIKYPLKYPKIASSLAVAVLCATIRISAWLLGKPWTGPSVGSVAMAFSLAAALAFTFLAVFHRWKARTLAEARLLAALDAYAEREITREGQSRAARLVATITKHEHRHFLRSQSSPPSQHQAADVRVCHEEFLLDL